MPVVVFAEQGQMLAAQWEGNIPGMLVLLCHVDCGARLIDSWLQHDLTAVRRCDNVQNPCAAMVYIPNRPNTSFALFTRLPAAFH